MAKKPKKDKMDKDPKGQVFLPPMMMGKMMGKGKKGKGKKKDKK